MQGFWKSWMTIWCLGLVGFGALLALAAFPSTDAMPRFVFDLYGGRDASFDAPGMRFSVGLMGAVTIGWGLTLLAALPSLVTAAAWRGVTGALMAWFVIDSSISIATGIPINAVSNTVLMIGYLIPLFASGALGERQTATA